MAQIIVDEGAAPATPSAGKVTVYAKTDGLVYSKDDAGTESVLSGAALAGSTSQVFSVGTATSAAHAVRFDQTSLIPGFKSGADIASAATVDLTAATGGTVTITGTSATSELTMSDGQHMTLVAAAAWPITYDATNCNVYGGVSITAYAGQVFDAFKTGGVVRIIPRLAKNIAFSVHKNGTAQTVATATYTKLTWSTEEFDTNATFATDKWTPGKLGQGQINASVNFAGGADQADLVAAIYKNGVIYKSRPVKSSGTGAQAVDVSSVVLVDAVTDYFEIYAYQATGGNSDVNGATNLTFFGGFML